MSTNSWLSSKKRNKRKKEYIFVRLKKLDVLNTSSPEDRKQETREFLFRFILFYIWNIIHIRLSIFVYWTLSRLLIKMILALIFQSYLYMHMRLLCLYLLIYKDTFYLFIFLHSLVSDEGLKFLISIMLNFSVCVWGGGFASRCNWSPL